MSDRKIDELLRHPTRFKLPWSRFDRAERWERAEVVATMFDDNGLTPTVWVVREGGCVLNFDGKWEREPMPSNRSDAFLDRTRFFTAEKAAVAAYEYFEEEKS